jgi:predicted ribosome quality control (RQC) complex YloA/Tae2 family protein
MKEEMSAFDILAVVGEMQPLVGGYLDKVFHWERKNVLLRVNVPGLGRREIIITDLKWLLLSTERPDVPEEPSQFAVHLRKLLSNSRVMAIEQQEFDRIVVIRLAAKEMDYQIVIELFGEGNLVLVSGGKIVNCIISKTWKHRDIRPGADYLFPPSRFNPRTASVESFVEAVQASSSDVVRTLATAVNLGGQLAEELCLRTGIDKRRKAKELSPEEVVALHTSLIQMLDASISEKRSCAVVEGEEAVDLTPVSLLQHKGKEQVCFQSFSEALLYFLAHRKQSNQRPQNPEIGRLERQAEQQREVASRLKIEADAWVKQAEALYASYQEVSDFLAGFGMAVRGKNWEEVKKLAKTVPGVEDADPEKNRVRVQLGDQPAWLDYTLGLDQNANLLYSQAKEAKEKVARAEDALGETERKIAQLKKEDEEVASRPRLTTKKTKEFWFEAYKWFLTTGGHLVLAGRDARTNDQVVKKHLTSQDRYAHADVHGAASVVVKDGATATEAELAEACQFALAHSKAWNAGATEGSAYWVMPDQVSKTPEAGEFVPRGAFIIRGKRNYVHHLKLELAVGEIDFQGSRKIMCAPVVSVVMRSTKYVVVAPGETGRGKIAAALAKEFMVPEEEVSRILPPGDIEIGQRVGFEPPNQEE